MRRSIFTDDHELFRHSVRTFIEREVTPNFERWDRDGIVDRELFTSAGATGFLGIDAPEQFGGGGVEDFCYNAIISEEFAYAGAAPAGIGITLHNDVCLPYFLSLTNEEQKQRWLPKFASGEIRGGNRHDRTWHWL